MKKKYLHKRSSEIFRKRYRKLNIDRRAVFLLFLCLFLALIEKKIIFVIIFSLINALLLSIERRTGISQDIEFSTFSSILFTLAYGIYWGLFMGFFTRFVANIYNSTFRIDHVFMVVGYWIAAFIALGLQPLNVMYIGFIATIIVNIYIFLVSKYVTMLSPFEIMMYGGSNLIFNLLLFSILSNPVLKLMLLIK